MLWKRAASATVAIWVLSPISTKKKAISVVRKALARELFTTAWSALSGMSVHAAIAMNDNATAMRTPLPCSRSVTK